MGVFYTSTRRSVPAINMAILEALTVHPDSIANLHHEAAKRTVDITSSTAPTFNPWRFAGALAIAVALLFASIWTGKHELPDISKTLIDCFSGYSGLVLGLLGGEAQTGSSE